MGASLTVTVLTGGAVLDRIKKEALTEVRMSGLTTTDAPEHSGSRLYWPFLVLTLLMIFAVQFAQIAEYSNATNEAFNNLGSSYRVEDKSFLDHFADTARSLCPTGNNACRHYQNQIVSNNTGNYPLTAIISRAMWLQNLGDFVRTAMRTAAIACLASLLIAIGFVTLLLGQVPRQIGYTVIGYGLIGVIFYLFGRTVWGGNIADLLNHPLALGAVALLIASAFWALLKVSDLRRFVIGLLDRIEANTVTARSTVFLIVALIVAIRLLGADIKVAEIALLAIFAVLFASSALGKGKHWADCSIFAMAFILLVHSRGLYHMFSPDSKEQIAFISLPLLAVLFFRPDSRLTFLLPVFLIFHVSVTALVLTAVFAAEFIVCVWRRRATQLLRWSLATGLVAFVLGRLGVSGWGTVQGAGLSALLQYARAEPSFVVSTVIGGGAFVGAGLWLMRKNEADRDAAARVVFLLGITLVLTRISYLIGSRHPFGSLEAEFSVLSLAPRYLMYIIYPSCMVTLATAWLSSFVPLNTSPQVERCLNTPAWLAFLALMAVAGSYVAAPGTLGRTAESWRILSNPQNVALSEPKLEMLRFGDDVYLLQRQEPKNNPLIYLSLLKFRMRVSAGLFQPKEARIEILN